MSINSLIIIFLISYVIHILLSILISVQKKQDIFTGISLGFLPIFGPIILCLITPKQAIHGLGTTARKTRRIEEKYVVLNYFVQIFLVVFIAVFVMMYFERGTTRLDLTIDKRFSLDDVTKNLLNKLDKSENPFVVRYYYSSVDVMPRRLRLLPSEIETLLKEYQKSSKNFKYEMLEVPPKIINSADEEETNESKITQYLEEAKIITPGSKEEKLDDDASDDEKKAYEIRKFLRDEKIGVIKEETYEGDKKTYQSFYSAFYITYALEEPLKDDRIYIPKKDEKKDYSIIAYANSILTKVLARLTNEKKTVIGLLTGHHEKHFELEGARMFKDILTRREGFEIKTIDLKKGNEFVPPEVDILIITATTDALTEREQFLLDQFIMKGGKIFFMSAPLIPPVKSQYMVSWQSGHGSWYEFIQKYGFKISPNKVAFDKRCFIADDGSSREELLTWVPKIKGDGLTEHPICAGIDETNFIYAGTVNKNYLTMNKNTTFEPIFKTSSQAWEVEINSDILQEPYAFDEKYNPALWEMMKAPSSGQKEFILAASIEGSFKSAYKRGFTPAVVDEAGIPQTAPVDNQKRKNEMVLQNSKYTRIVVLGNSLSYLIYPTLWKNEKMLLNIVYYLAYGREFLEIEKKTANIRPLTPVNSEQKTLIRFVVIVAVPLLLVILGLFLLVYRNQSRYYDQAVLELRKKRGN